MASAAAAAATTTTTPSVTASDALLPPSTTTTTTTHAAAHASAAILSALSRENISSARGGGGGGGGGASGSSPVKALLGGLMSSLPQPSLTPSRADYGGRSAAHDSSDLLYPQHRASPGLPPPGLGLSNAQMESLRASAFDVAREMSVPPPKTVEEVKVQPAEKPRPVPPPTTPPPNRDLEIQYENKLKGMEDRLRSQETDVHKQRIQNDTLSRDNNTLRETLSDKNDQLEALRRDMSILKRDLERSKAVREPESDRRIDSLIKENDRLADGLGEADREIDRLREVASRQAAEINALSQSLTQSQTFSSTLNESLLSASAALSDSKSQADRLASELSSSQAEVDRLEGELRMAATEAKRDRKKVGELKEALGEVLERYQRAVDEAGDVVGREKGLVGELRRLEVELGDSNAQVAVLTEDLKTCKQEKEDLLSISKKLERRILELESIEVECRRKVEDTTNKLEEAHLDNEKARLREHHLASEIEKLKEYVKDVTTRSKQKTETEITAYRSIRDKRAAESELSKLSKSIPEETERLTRIVEDMAGRLRISERERLEAVEAAEGLQQRLVREMNRVEVERDGFGGVNEELARRVRRGERDLEEAKEEAVKMMTKLSDLEHELETMKEERHQAHIRHHQSISETTSKYEQQVRIRKSSHRFQQTSKSLKNLGGKKKITELTTRLHHLTETHTRTTRDLQSLLTTHHSTSLRHKSDLQSLSSRYEATLADLQSQLARSAERLVELEETVRGLMIGRRELGEALQEERKLVGRLKGAVRVLEERCGVLAGRVEEGGRRERMVEVERARLQRDLDRLQIEKERAERVLKHSSNRSRPIPTLSQPTQSPKLPIRNVQLLQAEIDRIKSRTQSRPHFTQLQSDAFTSDSPTHDSETGATETRWKRGADVKGDVDARILMEELEDKFGGGEDEAGSGSEVDV
ncbi:hypothetical protein HDU67_005231 [Dinochytrium kinnereticum]|nr:hypothetical protein HDU67_005231 [Dinochytrium kinnereticum]